MNKVPVSVISGIILGVILIISVIGGTAFFYGKQSGPGVIVPSPTPTPIPTPVPSPIPGGIACTMEAKQCPDGSYVGRIGPNCEFAPCPSSKGLSCTSDSDCPSQNYTCEATEGYGTVSPNDSQPPTMVITKGECKLKVGGACKTDGQCVSGNLCHEGVCTSPVGNACSGPGDVACPKGYTCIQSCGPPVAREGDAPPPYFCELNEYAAKPKACPICLASNSNIATPSGEINVRDIKVGMPVWSLNKKGEKVEATILTVSRSPVPPTHNVVHIVLTDGREAWVSPNHPLTNGLRAGDLIAGTAYDGSVIESAERVPYWDTATYDILPSGDAGFYWANGILFASTLFRN